MSEKHYPYIGGSFDRIVFDGDGSVWVPESENAKLQDENARLRSCLSDDAENARQIMGESARLRELLDGCAVLLTDRDFLHWPELCDEVLGGMRELGVEVDE